MLKWIRNKLSKKENEDNDVCPICFSHENDVEFGIFIPCKHEICVNCLLEYKKRNIRECPMCRNNFIKTIYKNENVIQQDTRIKYMEDLQNSIIMAICLPRSIGIYMVEI